MMHMTEFFYFVQSAVCLLGYQDFTSGPLPVLIRRGPVIEILHNISYIFDFTTVIGQKNAHHALIIITNY